MKTRLWLPGHRLFHPLKIRFHIRYILVLKNLVGRSMDRGCIMCIREFPGFSGLRSAVFRSREIWNGIPPRTQVRKPYPGGENCSPGSSRLYRLGVSQAQKSQGVGRWAPAATRFIAFVQTSLFFMERVKTFQNANRQFLSVFEWEYRKRTDVPLVFQREHQKRNRRSLSLPMWSRNRKKDSLSITTEILEREQKFPQSSEGNRFSLSLLPGISEWVQTYLQCSHGNIGREKCVTSVLPRENRNGNLLRRQVLLHFLNRYSKENSFSPFFQCEHREENRFGRRISFRMRISEWE